jgi:hypothetical protein
MRYRRYDLLTDHRAIISIVFVRVVQPCFTS